MVKLCQIHNHPPQKAIFSTCQLHIVPVHLCPQNRTYQPPEPETGHLYSFIAIEIHQHPLSTGHASGPGCYIYIILDTSVEKPQPCPLPWQAPAQSFRVAFGLASGQRLTLTRGSKTEG